MKRNGFVALLLVFAVVVIGGWLRQGERFELVTAQASQGQLDLPLADAVQLQVLGGEWSYYPGLLAEDLPELDGPSFVTVAHSWPANPGTDHAYGYASYRLQLRGLDPGQTYGIFIQDEFSAYRLSVNGRPIVANGQVARSEAQYQPRVFTDTGYFFPDRSGQAELVMEIANFTRANGGFWNPPLLASAYTIDHYYNVHLASEVLIVTFALALGILFALLSFSMQDGRIFLMAVFLFVIALRMLCTGIHLIQILLPDLPLTVILPLEYASGYLLLPLAGLLLEAFDVSRFPAWLTWLYRALLPVMLLFTFLVPNSVLDASYQLIQPMVGLVALHALWILVHAVRRRENGIAYVVAGFLVLIVGAAIEFTPLKSRYSLLVASMLFILFLSVFVVIRLATLQTSHDRLATEVLTDALTGLGNRVALFRQLDHWQQRQDRVALAILYCDLNRFKAVNDTHGHAVGDEVLRVAAKRLLGSVRSTDRVYRVGGDEFVVLAEFKSGEKPDILVSRIKENFNQPFLIRELVLSVGISVGTQPFVPGQESADTVMSKSDARMYEDKRQGMTLSSEN